MNQDHVIDIQGRALISMCKTTSHVIANGRLAQDKHGNYTFSSSRGLSVTDYLLMQKDTLDQNFVKEFEVLDWTEFSDHAALYFSLNMKNHTKNTPLNTNESNTTETKKIVFDETKINEFNTLIKETNQNINTVFDENKTVDEKISILTKYLQENSACIFGKVIKTNPHNRQHKKPEWFDSTCKNAKNNFKHAKVLSIKVKLLKIDTILFSTEQNITIYAEKQNTAIESKKGHG